VIGLTATMMVVEIVSGFIFGSMALLADGWHMASHAAALSLTALGYYLARRHASNPEFSFGTGKIGELAGYSSALVLALIALLMAYESIKRFYSPVMISFHQAILVAVIGFFVNLACAFILSEGKHDQNHHVDHNLRAAYLHVLADALTSILAIVALTNGLFFGWVWMDPMMGIVGALIISRWSYGLMRDTARFLLDITRDQSLSRRIREALESEADIYISDLHVWSIGSGHFAAVISLVTSNPHPPEHYKKYLISFDELSHLTLEVNPFREGS
jgi:cation diffusion facilitator family transporter